METPLGTSLLGEFRAFNTNPSLTHLHVSEKGAFSSPIVPRTMSLNPTPLKRHSSEDVTQLDRKLFRRVSLGGKCQDLHLDVATEQKARNIRDTLAHAAKETYLITRLVFILLRSFGYVPSVVLKA